MDNNSTMLDDRLSVDQGTELTRAVRSGDYDLTKKLVADGASLDAKHHHETPLDTASRDGNTEIVEALLAAGADASLRRGGVFSALQLAAANGHALVLSALIRHGVDVNEWHRESGINYSPSHGRENIQPEAIAILVGAGASTHERDAGGGTSLHDASDDLSLEAAVALLKRGADINALLVISMDASHCTEQQIT
ncbi:ankyrin repeat protein E4_8 [Ectocarpus siliculosus]|uniref:Ankyrin repeat protein E4_8 n=1 Tax=Ectocarpus siliculosus TaxID=2880 RepID=D7G181_ECTSI|nr:ankyrin repeat protein E4_8 [Ectocarpus siliculosus]|eukprot:CBJ33191.1 ankyrin repeat protein E4_8 [Ectocarpus siliculosus]